MTPLQFIDRLKAEQFGVVATGQWPRSPAVEGQSDWTFLWRRDGVLAAIEQWNGIMHSSALLFDWKRTSFAPEYRGRNNAGSPVLETPIWNDPPYGLRGDVLLREPVACVSWQPGLQMGSHRVSLDRWWGQLLALGQFVAPWAVPIWDRAFHIPPGKEVIYLLPAPVQACVSAGDDSWK